MKRYFAIAAALLCLVACNKKGPDAPDSTTSDDPAPAGKTAKEMSFEASLLAVKSSVTADGSLIWVRNDQVSVFDGEANRQFKARSSAATATLTGEAVEADSYCFLYPYDASATLEGGKVKAAVAATQTALGADEPGFTGLAAGKTSTDKVDMHSMTGLVKFTIDPDAAGITALEMRASSGKVSGPVTIDFSSTVPALDLAEATGAVYIRPADGTFTPGATYYIASIPGKLAGVTVTIYKGSDASLVEVGDVEVGASVADLGEISIPASGDADERVLLGKWTLVRYGSRSEDDTEGTHIWWNDENDRSLLSSADNVLTFKTGGALEIDLGPDGYALSEAEGDFRPTFDNPGWSISKEGDDSWMTFSGGGFPLIVADAAGINGRYHIVSIGSGELHLEIFRTTEDGDGWFQIVLQPQGVSTFYHRFADGDFGLTYDKDEIYKLDNDGEEDSRTGTAVFDGFKWTMSVDSEEIFYTLSANAGIRVGIGFWREEEFTPEQVTFSTEDIPGNIKAVRIKACHNYDESNPEGFSQEVDIDVMATVGGLPFGTRYKLAHESKTYTFTSLSDASGKIEIDIKKNKGRYGLLIQAIEVVYQAE